MPYNQQFNALVTPEGNLIPLGGGSSRFPLSFLGTSLVNSIVGAGATTTMADPFEADANFWAGFDAIGDRGRGVSLSGDLNGEYGLTAVLQNPSISASEPDGAQARIDFARRVLESTNASEADVTKLQEMAKTLGYDLGPSDADGQLGGKNSYTRRAAYNLIAAEERGMAYDNVISQKAAEHGVPPEILKGLLWQESRFYTGVASDAGAAGIAQFIPDTARRYGLIVNTPGTEGYDSTLASTDERISSPEKSIGAAASYLSDIAKKFEAYAMTEDDKWRFALAAYNWGEGSPTLNRGFDKALRSAAADLKLGTDRSAWSGLISTQDVYNYLPRPQTRNYVKNIYDLGVGRGGYSSYFRNDFRK